MADAHAAPEFAFGGILCSRRMGMKPRNERNEEHNEMAAPWWSHTNGPSL
jgi:hypothetical protein